MNELQNNPKILVKRDGALGDVIMTTPIIREIFQDYDGLCELYVQTRCPDVFRNSPYVTGINPTNQLLYDAIYDLNLSYEKNPKIHTINAYKWSVFGNIELNDYSLDLFESASDKNKILSLEYKNYIVIHMRKQPSWPSRDLPTEFYKNLIGKILEETDATIIQVGAGQDLAFDGSVRLVNCINKFTIHEIKCLIDDARAYIGVDTGLLHIASCTNTPTIAFFTSCRSEYRKPLKDSIKFIPIEANISCYGCQQDNPPPCTVFTCRRGSIDCINTFDVLDTIIKLHSIL